MRCDGTSFPFVVVLGSNRLVIATLTHWFGLIPNKQMSEDPPSPYGEVEGG